MMPKTLPWMLSNPGRFAYALWIALAISVAPLAESWAQSAAYLTLDGAVNTPLMLSEADFKALPRTTLQVRDATGRDPRR